MCVRARARERERQTWGVGEVRLAIDLKGRAQVIQILRLLSCSLVQPQRQNLQAGLFLHGALSLYVQIWVSFGLARLLIPFAGNIPFASEDETNPNIFKTSPLEKGRSQGQNLALTVLAVPNSPDSALRLVSRSLVQPQRQHLQKWW